MIVQFQPSSVPDEWGTTQDGQTRPRVVKRGIDDDHDEIPDGEFTDSEEKHNKMIFYAVFASLLGELATVDHLVFMVHGIGPVCDLRFRNMVECGKYSRLGFVEAPLSRESSTSFVLSVDDFRSVSLKLLHSHYKKAVDEHAISRVEFLPVQWHTALHGDATGVDR